MPWNPDYYKTGLTARAQRDAAQYNLKFKFKNKKNKATSDKQQAQRMKKIRSKHNNLLNYFIHDKRDLSPAYVRSCEKFLKEVSAKHQAASAKLQAP